MIKHVALLTSAVALAGCAAMQPEPKVAAPPSAEGIEITKQQNGRFVAFVSPRLQHTQPFLGVAGTNFFALRSWFDTKTGETAHQVYVADSYYGKPYRWEAARSSDNETLKFVPISRNEITCDNGCAYFDEFAAEVPEGVLKAHPGGLSVTFTSKEGKSLAVNVPGQLVKEELLAVDTIRTGLGQVSAASAASSAPAPAAPPSPAPPSPAPPSPAPAPPAKPVATNSPAASGR